MALTQCVAFAHALHQFCRQYGVTFASDYENVISVFMDGDVITVDFGDEPSDRIKFLFDSARHNKRVVELAIEKAGVDAYAWGGTMPAYVVCDDDEPYWFLEAQFDYGNKWWYTRISSSEYYEFLAIAEKEHAEFLEKLAIVTGE